MLLAKCKVAAVVAMTLLVAVAASLGQILPAGDEGTAPPPAVAPPVAGDDAKWALARFGAVLDQQTVTELQQTATAVTTDATTYRCYMIDSAALADRFASALDSPGLRMLTPAVRWLQAGPEGRIPQDRFGLESGAMVTGTALHPLASSADGDVRFEQMVDGTTRLTMEYPIIRFGGALVSLEGQFRYQAPARAGQSVFIIAPAMKLEGQQFYHLVAWQTVRDGVDLADRPTDTAVWLGGQSDASPPPPPFKPIRATFQPNAAAPIVGELVSVQSSPEGRSTDGLQRYRATIRLTGVTPLPGQYVPAFATWDPPIPRSVADIQQRADGTTCVVVGHLPWYRRTATLKVGLGAGPSRPIGGLAPGDVGRTLPIDPADASPTAPTVTFVKIEPRTDIPHGCTFTAVSRHVGTRFNVTATAVDHDGQEVRVAGVQWGGGQESPELTWTAEFDAPADQLKEIRLAAQPLAWATFEGFTLLTTNDKTRRP